MSNYNFIPDKNGIDDITDMIDANRSAMYVRMRDYRPKRLAIGLHDKLCCYHNHMDGLYACGWNYEQDYIKFHSDDWNGTEHQKWLEKADKLLELTDNFILMMRIVNVISKIIMEARKMTENEFKDLEEKYLKAKAEFEEMKSLPKDKALAIYLHDSLCHEDNRGGDCSWRYEIEDGQHCWDKFEHDWWAIKANRLLRITDDIELIKKIIDVIK